MEAFGIMGMSLGAMGFIFALSALSKLSKLDNHSSFKPQMSGDKKVSERKENTRILYEMGSKTTERRVQILYEDGSREQNIETHTVYS